MDYEFSVVDIETTGTSEIYDSIYEIGVVRVRNGVIVKRFSSFIRTTKPLPKHILERRNLTQSHFAFAPSYDSVLKEFHNIVNGAPLFAHNKSFDERFLNYKSYKKLGKRIQTPFLCSMRLARDSVKGLDSYSLENLCNYFSIVNANPHQALADAEACCNVILRLIGEEPLFNVKQENDYSSGSFDSYVKQEPIIFKMKEED